MRDLDQEDGDENQDDLAISEQIRELARLRNITQEELARLTGFNLGTLKALLGGRTRWRVDHLFKLAPALGAQPRDLLPGSALPTPAYPSVDAAIRAGDAPAALHALAEALDRSRGGGQDLDELQMLRAMRARDASSMMMLTAHLMKKWGVE